MQEINKPLFIEVMTIYELNQKASEGYEFVCPIQRTHVSQDSNYANLNGTMAGAQFNLNGNLGQSTNYQSNTGYLMRLKPTEHLLYGQT